ncbi:MAG: 1-acyl-sn-glycerol-3-phosphate acyltransferase [Proteobacteria bacterium]|nr:1-acyl-sn-glycerol-3-phosphate acyltransferase [Pseudomonadota bacterium]MCL2309147.1 1-acyl-sn-glycerol-3-phosphate acyltransferase [Pseudomonadota bacterium]
MPERLLSMTAPARVEEGRRFSLERYWRIAATGFCFILFGLYGVLISCLVFPLLWLLVWPRSRRQRWARDVVHWALRFFCYVMTTVGAISYEVHGREKLQRRGLLVIANHPSLIDVVLLMSLLRQPDCVVKAAAWRNPFMLGPVSLCGFIRNQDGPQLIDDCIASVRRGSNLIIFPEGTRTRIEGLLQRRVNPLQRGVANIAVRGQLPVTPVVITVTEPMLTKQQSWYQAPLRRPHFVLTVYDDLTPTCAGNTPPAVASRALTEALSDFFNQELKKDVRPD